MKATPFIGTIIPLAITVAASPLHKRSIFGSGDNLVSNIFDSASCIVSNVIGGGNPKCHGSGEAHARPSAGGDEEPIQYTYTYDTNDDGTLKVVINLERGGSCKYNLRADGYQIKKVIDGAAKRCHDEHK
ncbi:hypothetical protein NQ176_g281 [Zarea fungicola]|uniref:Uncharacterized protein n=1 Tax=Zarea fungicola TaxID=93591 RepID=A0ACC1NYG8_9HYPO|nr:hypothetical protein NQ176_g281 [Lecanicillium fungicola]